MLALRYAAVLALALWIGGMVALGAFAAPAAFDVLGARGSEGRMLAGAVFGEALRRFQIGAYLCGAVLLASLGVRAILGPRPRYFALRLATAVLIVSSSLYTGLVLMPQVERAQRTLGVSPSTLSQADPRRIEFDRLHGFSTSLQLVPVLGGLALLFFELKD